MSNPDPKLDMRAKIVWLCLMLSPVLLMLNYFSDLWKLEQYKYFPALLLALGMLLYARWDRSLSLPTHWVAWSLLLLGGIATAIGAAYWSPWLGCLGFVMILGSFLSCCNVSAADGWGMIALWPASWMLLRLPLNLDFQLTGWLQSVTARVSSHLLDRIDIPHRLTGNVFHLPGGTLFVEAACSGIQSLFALLFCAMLWVVWQRRSMVLMPLYVLAAIGWAGLMNILRVTVIAIAQEWWQFDLAHGWPHELLGYICLFIAIGLLISTDRAFRVFFYPIPRDAGRPVANPMLEIWNKWLSAMGSAELVHKRSSGSARPAAVARWAFPVAALLAPLVIVPQMVFGYVHWTTIPEYQKTDFWQPSADLLAQVAGLEVIEHNTSKDASNPALGIHSNVWVCRQNGIVTRILASQHAEVHDLCKCYGANGWQIKDRELVEAKRADSDAKWDVVEASFVNSETIFGELFFSTVDRQARPVRLRGWGLSDFVLQRVDRGAQPQQSGFDGQTVNIQLWSTSETPFTEEQRESLRVLHRQIRELIRADLASAHK
jgi:exosortase